MVDATIEHELSTCLRRLSVEQQRQVLEFARTLTTPPLQGVRGSNLLQFAGTIDESDLEAMSQAIKDGCERVDTDEW
jgi:hypothetical protein